MSTDTLTTKAQAVCAQHYGKLGSGCGKCPIQSACHSPVNPLTQQTLAAWRQRVADAAERVAL